MKSSWPEKRAEALAIMSPMPHSSDRLRNTTAKSRERIKFMTRSLNSSGAGPSNIVLKRSLHARTSAMFCSKTERAVCPANAGCEEMPEIKP